MKVNKAAFKVASFVLCLIILLSSVGCISIDRVVKTSGGKVNTEYYYVDSEGNISTEPFTLNGNNNYVDYDSSNGWSNNYNNTTTVAPTVNDNNDDNSANSTTDDTNEPADEEDEGPKNDYDDVTVVPDTEIFSDNFESYGVKGDYIKAYSYDGGDNAEAYVDDGAYEGNYCGKFSRTLGSASWAALTYRFEGGFQNWKNQKYVSFWAKGDGRSNTMAFQYGDGVEVKRTELEDLTTEWTFYSYELDTSNLNMENIKYCLFTWTGATATCWIDDVRVTETKVKNYVDYIIEEDGTVVENGECYEGDGKYVESAYKLITEDGYSEEAKVSLVNDEKHSGDYAIKVTGKATATAPMMAYRAELSFERSISKIIQPSVWIKGDGTENQKVYILLCKGDSEVAMAIFEVTAEWKQYFFNVSIPKGKTFISFDNIIILSELGEAEQSFWFDDFELEAVGGVAVPNNIIENGEYYGNSLSVTDVYTVNDDSSVSTTVSLDTTIKNNGENSVKFAMAAASGSKTTSSLTYIFQPKTVGKRDHFKLEARSDNASGSQDISIILYNLEAQEVGKLETSFDADGQWHSLTIDNILGETNVGYAKIILGAGNTANNVWIDDFESYYREPTAEELSRIDQVVLTPGMWGEKVSTGKVVFDEPIDVSGSNGTIVITETAPVITKVAYDFTLYINGKATRMKAKPYSIYEGEFKTVISLSDLGITDDDLKNVTGYKLDTFGHNGATEDGCTGSMVTVNFDISAPRAE